MTGQRQLRTTMASALFIASAVFFSPGCDGQKGPPPAPAPTAVTVSQPAREKVSDFIEFPGNTVAFATVDLRARVKGFLKKIAFEEGAVIKEGDLLFEIEPDVYQAELDRAKAALQASQANLEKSKADLAIKEEMAAGNAASKLEVIQAKAAVATAEAAVAGSSAAIEQAQLNLNYTKVFAPLSGRINRSQVDVGNLVGADGNTLLATIVKSDPIYVYFDVDEATVQRFQARMRERGKGSNPTGAPSLPIMLALGETGDFQYKGAIDYVDNQVDPSTGTLKVRASIPNANMALAPGFFGRVRVPDGEPYDGMLVPERAIGVDQGQKYLLVVNDKNTVEMRPIEPGTQQGRLRVIKKGLKPDDWVITEGVLRTRPGATVAPMQKPLAEPTTAPVAASN